MERAGRQRVQSVLAGGDDAQQVIVDAPLPPGNGADSNIDFLVDLDQGRGLLDLGGLLSGPQDLSGVEVDLVESGSIHPYIRDRVVAEAIAL